MEAPLQNADISLVNEDKFNQNNSNVLENEENDIDYNDFVEGYNTSQTELKTSMKASEVDDNLGLNSSEIWSLNHSHNMEPHNPILDDAIIEDFSTIDDSKICLN